MSNIYGLYTFTNHIQLAKVSNVVIQYKKMTKGLFFKGEKRTIKKLFQRLYFAIITFGNCFLFVATIGSEFVHTSFVVGKTAKFPFLKKGEAEIGPCHTEPNFRGQGIYPLVINQIINTNLFTSYFLIIEEGNCSSIRGASKAGFTKFAYAKKTAFKCYKLIKEVR